RKIKRRVGAERQPDSVRRERNAADEIVYRRAQRSATRKAVIDGDFERVEAIEVFARPIGNGRAKTDTNRGRQRTRRHLYLFTPCCSSNATGIRCGSANLPSGRGARVCVKYPTRLSGQSSRSYNRSFGALPAPSTWDGLHSGTSARPTARAIHPDR